MLSFTDANGEVTRWITEGLAATLLRGLGWSRDTNSEGDVNRVTGNSSRNDDVDGQSNLCMDLVISNRKFLTETWTRTWTKSYDSAFEFVPNDCQKPLDS
ncbi:MAG: hypothetical protein KTR16_13615 [Acidiferrobacterales bacterium]|nr:hypothetical protein [Acidiferrobacterales bacterium]